MTNLLPCPFCGANPHRGLTKPFADQMHGELLQHYRIWCPHNCASKRAGNEQLAIADWNTRSGPAQSQGQTKDNFEKAWAKRPWLNEEETDKDRAFRWWCAALALGNAAQTQSLITDEMVNAAAREMWNDRDARHGGSWDSRDPREICVIQTKATAKAALKAALAPGNGAVEAATSSDGGVEGHAASDTEIFTGLGSASPILGMPDEGLRQYMPLAGVEPGPSEKLSGLHEEMILMGFHNSPSETSAAPSPAALDPVTVERCAKVIAEISQREAGMTDSLHSGLAGASRRDALGDAYDAVRALIGQPSSRVSSTNEASS